MFVGRGVRLDPQITGGGQERDRRGGTSNVPAIVGMGVAAEAAKDWLDSLDPTAPFAELESRRDRFESAIRETLSDVVEVATNGGDAPRLWTTANLGFTRLAAEGMLIAMSERGVMASAGAACSSGSLEPSPILMAMGVPETVAHGSIRFSFARDTTDAEIDAAIPIVAEVVRAIAR